MKKNVVWDRLTILNVLGTSPEEAGAVISVNTQVGGEEIKRIYPAKNGVLIQLRDTDTDAGVAAILLEEKFGKDKITEIG